MKPGTCKRLWEVEAARDGRLSGKALAAFEEHAAACRDCGAERRALEVLRRKLADYETPVDEISRRRQREKLLAQADSGLRNPSGERRGAIVALAIACAVATLIGWAAVRAKPAPARSSPIASVVASPAARWERHRTKELEQIALTDGVLSLLVKRSASDPRVSVRVPDGEIEDVGTSFRVTVQGGRTREIVVLDGSVVFRRQGQPALLLASPSVWVAPAAGMEAPAEPAKPTETAIVTAPPPPRPSPELRTRQQPRKVAPSIAPSSEGAPPDEDLAYLNIVALRREGRVEEARVAAGAYLRRFPHGFRRDEVLPLVREPR